MKPWLVLGAICAGIASTASAQKVLPWTETVISVDDLDASSRLFRDLGGWRVVREDTVDAAELRYWKLPETASGRFQLICAPKARIGCIRFVKFQGAGEQKPIRAALRAWDTGGIFSVMVRSDNVPQLYENALKLGWWAESPPIRFQFGTSDLRNVVLTGPHGVNLAVYERISPDFTAFPVGPVSQAFNSMRMVRNKPIAREFYEEKLGFQLLFDSANESEKPTPSNFGIPLNYTPKIKRSAAALQPQPGEIGRVEVMQIEGFEGLDASKAAGPPNFGILSVRYPVESLRGYRKQLEARGVKVEYAADKVAIGSIGLVDIFAVRDPDGNLTEFYELSE
ncbi:MULTISPECIES: VOC family protein [Sphingomonadales]|uniref:VOC family protein n=1 Tax=Sphingomonadales TaxID=204457 RepID=UPI003266A555